MVVSIKVFTLPTVGFEPTRTNTDDLKSSPLDLSGMLAFCLKVFTLPNVGFEPTATRLKVLRSTDWANSAYFPLREHLTDYLVCLSCINLKYEFKVSTVYQWWVVNSINLLKNTDWYFLKVNFGNRLENYYDLLSEYWIHNNIMIYIKNLFLNT